MSLLFAYITHSPYKVFGAIIDVKWSRLGNLKEGDERFR